MSLCYGVAATSIGDNQKETYNRDDILQKRHIILRSLLIIGTPLVYAR